MTIHCQCSHCKTRMKLPARLAGSKARCPKCKKVFLIPNGENEATVDEAAAVVAQAPASPQVDKGDESDRNPPITAAEVPSNPEPIDAEVVEPANAPSSIGPPQEVVPDEATLPVAQAVPVDQPAGSIPMATPVIEPTTTQNAIAATPDVGVVAPTKVRRRRKSGLKGMMGFILGLFALLGCLAILAGVGYWLSTRGPQNGTVAISIPVEHRSDCVLFIDGDDYEISRVGPIELVLAAGTHEIELRRLGFEPLKMRVLVAARKDIPVTPDWVPVTDPEVNAATQSHQAEEHLPQLEMPAVTPNDLESPEEQPAIEEPAME